MINKQSYQITGMKQDNLVGTGFSSKFAHEIKNMRLNTVGDYTTASWTTEKGTKSITVEKAPMPSGLTYSWITDKPYYEYIQEGGVIRREVIGHYSVGDFNPIGQAVINDTWVLFGIVPNKDVPIVGMDREKDANVILSLYYSADTGGVEHLYGRILYWGNLDFDQQYPIETVVFYENEKLQKVYWTDGKNQPRVINIKGAEDRQKGFDESISTQFDFTQEVSLTETVEIEKDKYGAGLFPPGTVKYAISYYHQYGQETNIVYDSPLYYPVLGERGCNSDELSGDSFFIKVSNLDLTHGFDYIRLYSIVKTSNNATPIVRIVEDKSLKGLTSTDTVTFHDTNTTGSIIDPTIIQFIGGREIVAHTFDQKNNTLFFGNIELKTKSATEALGDTIIDVQNNANNTGDTETFIFNNDIREPLGIRKEVNDNSVYQWVSQLNQNEIKNIGQSSYIRKSANSQYVKHFKYKETYRFGIQFQDTKGAWSEVIYLNDLTNNVKPHTEEGNTECKFAGAQYTLPASASIKLHTNGYKKARLVCCYPTNADRAILAQGVITPTVYNNEWRASHAPDVMSSWFFRPNDKKVIGASTFDRYVLPWTDDKPLDEIYLSSQNSDGYHIYKTVPEIQSTYHANTGGDECQLPAQFPSSFSSWEKDRSVYKVCRKVMTFHSPEIEFDDTLRTMPSENWEVYVIGQIPINSYAAKYYLEASAMSTAYSGSRGTGLSREFESKTVEINNPQTGSHVTALGEWNDINLYTTKEEQDEFLPYCIYPFQRKGSLCNYLKDIKEWQIKGDDTINITSCSILQSKILSHILYSTTALFRDNEVQILSKEDNATFNIFDSTEVSPLKLKTNDLSDTVYNGEDLIYYGNLNGISPISARLKESWLRGYSKKNSIKMTGAYPLAYYQTRTSGEIKYSVGGVFATDENDSKAQGVYTSDPVPITYKSTAHGVFFTSGMDILDSNLSRELTNKPFLYLAEIRKQVNAETRFGGKPTDKPINNIYVPCGPTVELTNTDVILNATEGDTYYMRYDNLKTYPFSSNDTNQIVEILSFMVETRLNLDGRYDRNRGLLDNTTVTNTNFDLINKSYTQDNNTFTFLTLDQMSAELNNFANQITWTKEKVSGEEVDAWTNITMASTANANGTLGAITKILNLNDKLYLFQDHGIAQINFNENTAISTESGIPLELAKTGKYTGLDYLSTEIGCQNKWSISTTKNGVFFIDDSRQELLTLSEGFTSLSTLNGFDAFMIKQLPSIFKPWNPAQFDNFVTYYDKLSNDIYYINKNTCLAWNEQTKTFTSFYDYEKVPYMVNIGQHSLMWNKGVWATREDTSYSSFFGNIKPYWMTIVCDGMTDRGSAFPADKVFNNIEYRADIYNLDGSNTNYNHAIFNKKHVWNGYQDSQECVLDGIRKFNVWRVQLPRHYGTRDRIRNPFCYIKLSQDQLVNQTDRVILHDLAVYFDMK